LAALKTGEKKTQNENPLTPGRRGKKDKTNQRSDGRKKTHECGKATAADAHSVGSNRGDSNVQLVFLRFHWFKLFPTSNSLSSCSSSWCLIIFLSPKVLIY
jgi:hypothetical protein